MLSFECLRENHSPTNAWCIIAQIQINLNAMKNVETKPTSAKFRVKSKHTAEGRFLFAKLRELDSSFA